MGICHDCQKYTDVDANRICRRCIGRPECERKTYLNVVKHLIWRISWGRETTKKDSRRGWRGSVYQATEEVSRITLGEWEEIRHSIILRDHRRCKRCDKRFIEKNLTVHHITPREDGGSDDSTNLVSLCVECHNFVEGRFFTLADIIGSYGDRSYHETLEHEPIREMVRPDWHRYVYGGVKHGISKIQRIQATVSQRGC